MPDDVIRRRRRRRRRPNMERSAIYLRIHYLLELGSAETTRLRLGLIGLMTPGQMDCLRILARQILEGHILLAPNDVEPFRLYRDLLRALTSRIILTERKKRLLRSRHTLIPRLVRPAYLRQAIRNELRSPEE